MNFEHIPDTIIELLQNKQASELSEEEKKQIVSYFPLEEFEDYQKIIASFQELDEQLEVAPLKMNIKEPSMWARILNYPIPAYQVAAAFLFLFFSYTLYWNSISVPNYEGESIKVNSLKKGKSLAEDDYPDSLVFNL